MSGLRELENELLGRVTERVIISVAKSKFGPYLWLAALPMKPTKRLNYVYRPDPRILQRDGFVPGQTFGTKGFLEAFLSYVKLLCAPELILDEKKVEATGRRITIEAEVLDDGITMPLILNFNENNEEIAPERLRFVPKTISDPPEEIFVFPTERTAAYDMAGILKSLEFTNDYSRFGELYDIASHFPCDGTLLSVSMKNALTENEVELTDGRKKCFDMFSSDKRMKKKWEQYKKRNGLFAEWEEVCGKLKDFFTPVFESVSGEIPGKAFFGDWMPELARYLDV